MKQLKIIRTDCGETRTIGCFLVDANHKFYSLEDTVREPFPWEKQEPVLKWKIPGRTAIPRGKYKIGWTWSNRFKKPTLELYSVPGFSGIRIHAGNSSEDTEGCILLGKSRDFDYIHESKQAVMELEDLLLSQNSDPIKRRLIEETWLEII